MALIDPSPLHLPDSNQRTSGAVHDHLISGIHTVGERNNRTIAIVRKAWALAILYIGRSVTCGINYVFTPEEDFSNTHTRGCRRILSFL